MRTKDWTPTLAFWQAFALAGTLALAGCSGQQQQDDLLEVEDDEYAGNSAGDLGQDDAAEGNGQENFVEDDDYANYAQSNQYANNYDSTEVNSASSDDYAVEDAETETVNATLDSSGTTATDYATAPATNTATAAAGANYAGGAMTPPPTAAAAVPSDRAPVPGGRVRYVPEGGVEVLSGPGGSPVLTLNQGEHPLTWEENGWLRLTQGMYVPMGALSDRGVGRASYGVSWGGSGGGSAGYSGGYSSGY